MKRAYFIIAVVAAFSALFTECKSNTNSNDREEAILLSINKFAVTADGGSQIVGIDANCDWSTQCDATWVTLSRESGSAQDKSCTITVKPNTTSSVRTASVFFYSATTEIGDSVAITQEANTDNPSDNPNDDPNDNPNDNPNDDPDDDSISVTQAITATQNSKVKLKESIVAAVSTKSYLLTDGTSHILAFKNSEPNLEIGDRVTVEGTISEYGGLVQLSDPVSTKTGFEDDFRHPSVVEFSGADADAFLNDPYIRFVKLRGKLNKSSNYYNITLSDPSSAMASLAYPSAEMCPESFNGKEIEVYGYTIYTTKGQYVYIIATGVKVIDNNPDDGGGSGDDGGNTGGGDDDGGDTGGNTGSGDAVFYRDWAELPLCDDRGSNFQYVSHGGISVGGKSNQRNYTMCFDKANKAAIWVAYPLHKNYIGSSGRTNDWQHDPKIATQYQADLHNSYDGSYDRGHQLPSGSRTCSKTANSATFYYSNMTPQAEKFNQNGWATLENNVRNEICSDTLYVVTGALFKGNNHSSIKSYTYDAEGNKCPIPSHYYKVLLRTKRGNTGKAIKNITSASEIKAVAILLEHTSSLTSIPNSAFISVKELEEFSGITFFPALNDAIEAEVKQQKNRNDWSF